MANTEVPTQTEAVPSTKSKQGPNSSTERSSMQIELQRFGVWLIKLSVIGFAASAALTFTIYSGLDEGALPAMSFLLLMVGLAFAFPSLLEENVGEVSTMRIIIFSVVLIFCVINFKIGWDLSNFEEFTIDDTWLYILGLAFGAKTVQKFAEEDVEK